MHDPLAKAHCPDGPGIVAGDVFREQGKHTAVPFADLFPARRRLLIRQVKAVTGGTQVRAGAAALTFARHRLPDIVFEQFLQSGLGTIQFQGRLDFLPGFRGRLRPVAVFSSIRSKQ